MPFALLLSLLTASPDAGVAPKIFRPLNLAVPGAFEVVEVPETIRALDVPMKMKAVRTRTKLDELTRWFRVEFERAGLFVTADGEIKNPGPLRHVTAYDPDHENSVSVLFQPNLDGTTTVIIGEAYLHAARPTGGSPFAPVMPGASPPLTAESESGRTLSYTVKAKPAEIDAYYRETLGKAGYRETSPGQFERDRTRLQLWVKPRPSGETSVTVIQTERPAP